MQSLKIKGRYEGFQEDELIEVPYLWCCVGLVDHNDVSTAEVDIARVVARLEAAAGEE
jgi:hypothetical protein